MTEAQDLSHFVRRPADGVAAMDLVVDGVYCGACIVTIEKGLRRESGVRGARVNLASKRVTVEWNDGALDPPVILERLEALGYPAHPFAAETVESVENPGRKASRVRMSMVRDRPKVHLDKGLASRLISTVHRSVYLTLVAKSSFATLDSVSRWKLVRVLGGTPSENIIVGCRRVVETMAWRICAGCRRLNRRAHVQTRSSA